MWLTFSHRRATAVLRGGTHDECRRRHFCRGVAGENLHRLQTQDVGGEIERPWFAQKGGVNHGRGTQSHPRVLPAGPAWAWAAASEGCSSDQGSGWQQCSVRLSWAFQRGQGGGRCVQPTTCGPSRAASRTSRCSRRSMRAASRGRAAARSKPSKKTEVQFPSRVPLVVFRAHQTRAHEHQKHGRQHGASATRICSSP